MKHIETFEARRSRDYRGIKQRKKEAIEQSVKIKDYLPSSYIIFKVGFVKRFDYQTYTFDREDSIVLGRIMDVRKDMLGVSVIKYTIVDVKDFDISEGQVLRVGLAEKEKENILYTTTSLQEAEKKYSKFIEEYELQRDIKKYNL